MRAWTLMQALSSLGELRTVVLPVAESRTHAEIIENVNRVPAIDPARAAASWVGWVRGRTLLQQVPELPQRARLAAPVYGEKVDACCGKNGFDLVYILRSYLAGTVLPLMSRYPRVKYLLDIDEADHRVMAQCADLQDKQGAHELAKNSRIEAARMLRFARQTLSWFDAVSCSSIQEAEDLMTSFGISAAYLPNVITLSNKIVPLYSGPTARILFLGNLDYWPNRDALIRLLTMIFPRVQEKIPGVELMVVGPGAMDLKKDFAEAGGVNWMGYVNNLSNVYDKVGVCLVPLRAGGGSRIKVLEAFAHGIPVVATAKAVEGLAVDHGMQVLLGESDDEIVAAVLSIIRDRRKALDLSQRAREYVVENHSPERLEQNLRQLVTQALAG